jgi:dTDP-4-amino-4,6-dideoxygalactose transaminase
MTTVPLVDLQSAHAEVAEEVELGFKRVMTSASFVGGAEVAAFEREYAAFCGLPYCVGVANGTDALELALRAVGVGPGSEVILPANTFIATAEAVTRAGGRVVLVDIDPTSYLIDVDAALAAVTPATRAIVPVHLYGQLAPVEHLADGLSTSRAGGTVAIVEDAAQCQGATRFGNPAGSWGIAATSFYPGKNLGAYGDAGAVVTTDERLATVVRTLGSHGGLTRYAHDLIGCNSRLDALQAVVLRAKLGRLAGWNAARRTAAARYDAMLESMDVARPTTLPGNEHVWHLYVVRIPGDGTADRRDAVVNRMTAAGIGAAIHYPTPVHLTRAFAGLRHSPGDFPHAEAAAAQILSLPIYPHLNADQQHAVVDALTSALC